MSDTETRVHDGESGCGFPGPGATPLPGGDSVHLWLYNGEARGGSGAFLRRVLARYTGDSPERIELARGEHGKPELVHCDSSLQFNLTHTRGRLLCAVTGGQPVGVDLESSQGARDIMKLARRFFTAQEVALLEALPVKERAGCFYDHWTLKEAAVKARGAALAPALRHRGFALSHSADGAWRISVDPPEPDSFYCLLDPEPGFRAALCLLGPAQGPPVLSLFRHGAAATPESPALRAASA